MPRKIELTWQAGSEGRKGRWRKKYKGRVLYFPYGNSKSDLEGYHQALEDWKREKAKIDEEEAQKPKLHQAEYEQAIDQWTLALQWSRDNGDQDSANSALQKLEELRAKLENPVPPSLAWGDHVLDIGFPPDLLNSVNEALYKVVPDRRPVDPGTPGVIVPSQELVDEMDGSPTRIAREIWKDRLDVQRQKGRQTADTVESHVDAFLANKRVQVNAGEVSAGRYDPLRVHLHHFRDWLGGAVAVASITGKVISDYYAELLRGITEKRWSADYAKDRLNAVKSFVRWLWTLDLIELPKVLNSADLRISKKITTPEVFTIEEVKAFLAAATDRTKLYLLLMINTGMLQKDIADLRQTEVNWEKGTVTRKRSKTADYANVPTVTYNLWKETFGLLQQHRAKEGEFALTNQDGGCLKVEMLNQDGKLHKIDNVRSAFNRLSRATKIIKPLKLLRKTSATLLRSNRLFSGVENLFLGHAPRSMSDRHYAQTPQELFDEAIAWLGKQYGVE